MKNEITNNSYSNYIEKIQQIIRLFFYIFYKRPRIVGRGLKVPKHIYSSNYGD